MIDVPFDRRIPDASDSAESPSSSLDSTKSERARVNAVFSPRQGVEGIVDSGNQGDCVERCDSCVNELQTCWKTKAQIADHFQIGIRTVTKLMQRKVLPYVRLRNLVRFDVARCDRSVGLFRVRSSAGPKEVGKDCKRYWRTKSQLAKHIGVSERTITTLMKRRILPYIKVGRWVRFDENECDLTLNAVHVRSIAEIRKRISAP